MTVIADVLAGRRPWWWEQAACRGEPAHLFFPDRGDAGNVRLARSICAECPVKLDCGSWAVEHNERFGMWGGTSPRERRVIRRRLGLVDSTFDDDW